ncbi:unnamed protein product [Spirodela intermedia]|uniref:Uncharacterized protein n=1 Tax=Spirodela intermedia TaxID=51605 RepID=A0A7I8IFA0_SPIIN|nr:unnamed protein product [Spirodela intermedia]CAA6656065.1 unnamed protein product [Spirodela intermedia]
MGGGCCCGNSPLGRNVRIAAVPLGAVVCTCGAQFFDWNVTFGVIHPLGVPQQGILINGEFPGPDIYSVTNDNLIINVHNSLPEPFLISWNGIQQRRNSWQDGVFGTNCPIPPGRNFTYVLQVKDQIGSFFYFPSLGFHKAAGGFGGIRIVSRPRIPVPFADPAGDFTLLVGDWYKSNHTVNSEYFPLVGSKDHLDRGKKLRFPDGILINGRGPNGASFTVDQGKPSLPASTSTEAIELRKGHKMKLIEVEGTHTLQETYSSVDVHVGQSLSVLVTTDQPSGTTTSSCPLDSRSPFLRPPGSSITAAPPRTSPASLREGRRPRSTGLSARLVQSGTLFFFYPASWYRRLFKLFLRFPSTNLTASGPRPNPQGSYHYGLINITRTIRLASSAAQVNGKQRYAVNSVSFTPADTPLKIADLYKIGGVFRLGSISDSPTGAREHLDTSVMAGDFRAFVEIVFENKESIVQSWHLDGYSFFIVGMDGGRWSPSSRKQYNLRDAVARCTTQVYPRSWTAVYLALDNVGMWNLRTEHWARQYLGQQLYLRVYSPLESTRDEYPIPRNALLCGRASGHRTRSLTQSRSGIALRFS